MSVADVLLASFFAAWLVLTLVRQFHGRLVTSLTGWDQVGLIPVYRFFAPFPGRFDYHFLVRNRAADAGSFSAWVEFGPSNERGPWSTVVNPRKRLRKAYLDLATELARELQAHGGEVEKVNLSYPYLSFLLAAEDFLQTRLRVPGGTRFQFLVLASHGREPRDMEPLLLSSIHCTE